MEDAGLKVVFSEVLKGFTLVESKNYGKIQVKHFTNFDSAELDIKNKLFYDKAINQGLPSRNDRIEYLLKENIWTEEKNKEILQVKSMLSGLRNSKSKVFLQAHIDNINTQIGENQKKLADLEFEKEELIGFCAENYASRRINEHYMYNAVLNDKGEKLFGAEEFEELEENSLVELIGLYIRSTKKFDSNSSIALLGLSFKPNTDDIRDSTSLKIASILQEHNIKINCYDPAAMANAKKHNKKLNFFILIKSKKC